MEPSSDAEITLTLSWAPHMSVAKKGMGPQGAVHAGLEEEPRW